MDLESLRSELILIRATSLVRLWVSCGNSGQFWCLIWGILGIFSSGSWEVLGSIRVVVSLVAEKPKGKCRLRLFHWQKLSRGNSEI